MSSTLSRNAFRAAYHAQQRALLYQTVAAHRVLRRLAGAEFRPEPGAVRKLQARYDELIERDLENAEAGVYPKQLLFQIPVAEYAKLFPKLVSDFPRIVRRAKRGDYQDLPEDVNLEEYPAYYRRNFHWQTDGYLSRRSAELYDVGVEFLFLGLADVMRRQVLPPIAHYVGDEGITRGRILDVGSGPGSMLRQLVGAYPEHKYYGLELSPFYAQFARERLAHADVTMVSENAEKMPFRDEYFDIVTCVHLLHELPQNARRNVLWEMQRVLRPGGLLVIEDSAQASDGNPVQPFLERFADEFHEPFYRDYLHDDLAPVLRDMGFVVQSEQSCFVAKIVVAKRTSVGRFRAPLTRRLD